MQALPAEIYSVDDVRAMDRCAIDVAGVAGYTLMTRAGEAAVRETLAAFPKSRRWAVLCGAGNNAGDGYVLARLAREQGITVDLIAVSDPDALSGDAATARDDYRAAGGRVLAWPQPIDPDADVLVDALLGSGLARPVGGRIADAVAAIYAHRAPVVALDLPTGIHGDTGARLGSAVDADLTITFVALKAGLFLGDGIAAAGSLAFDGLGVPGECRRRAEPVLRRMTGRVLRTALPRRRRDAHKGHFGHVAVVGGGPGMPGAARLAGEAALRAGAGKVTVATWPAHAASIGTACPELMTCAVDTAATLSALLDIVDVVAFGPGLGDGDWARGVFDVVAASPLPSVWDADALNLLARDKGGRGPVAARVITPHPGEAARLLGMSARDVQADRRGTVLALQRRYGGVAVLKGAGTLVAVHDTVPAVCTAGNPGMAAAGMGDVLTGVIGGLLAQGLAPATAATAGVLLHARAGDLAAEEGERGLMARDVIAALRPAMQAAVGRG